MATKKEIAEVLKKKEDKVTKGVTTVKDLYARKAKQSEQDLKGNSQKKADEKKNVKKEPVENTED